MYPHVAIITLGTSPQVLRYTTYGEMVGEVFQMLIKHEQLREICEEMEEMHYKLSYEPKQIEW